MHEEHASDTRKFIIKIFNQKIQLLCLRNQDRGELGEDLFTKIGLTIS